MADYVIDPKETLRYLGYRGQTIDSETAERIARMSELCLKTAKPDYVYRFFEFTPSGQGVRLNGTDTVFPGEDLKGHLHGAKRLCLTAATLGLDCDRTLMRLEARSISDAVCFNAASVALIEAVSDSAQREINSLASREGLTVGGRYSPGYGDFPLSSQKDVLRLLGAGERLGITLSDSLLMLPRKSVTGVVGLYEDRPEEKVSCTVCTMRDWCEFRKGGEHCG